MASIKDELKQFQQPTVKQPAYLLGTYDLLSKYADEAAVCGSAHSLQAGYFRDMYRMLTYPIIVLSSVSAVMSVVNPSPYVWMGLSLATMILSGFNQGIDPKQREHENRQISIEYNEIHRNVLQYIGENSKSHSEIKQYSQHIRELLNVWHSQAPNVRDRYIKQAKLECSYRVRASGSVKKKDVTEGS